MKRYDFAALAAQHLRECGMVGIQWGDEALAHEIADKAGLAQNGLATMSKILDRLEGSPLFRKSIVGLAGVGRVRRFDLVNPGASPGDRRKLLTADVWKSLPRELCPACGGTRSITVESKKYVGQIVQVKRGGETWTAGRFSEHFAPVPFVTCDEKERWCECSDRSLPF
jgi:hypothetical protein